MDATSAVLRRLDRIEQLEQRDASPRELLPELRALVLEAEAWARREGDERARVAVAEVREALAPSPALNLALEEGC